MARKTFFSFQYKPDNWRASQVRNMGVLEGNAPCSDNGWEQITKGGDTAIQRWIDSEMEGRTCTVVLIGSGTAGRKWINYEIVKSWNDAKGVLGVYIHGLKDKDGNQATRGGNPFDHITRNGSPLSGIVSTYDPPYYSSKDVYSYINENLAQWVEDAIALRMRY